MNTLLLTNSISFENEFIHQLNAMKHEVFCSEQLLYLLKDGLQPDRLLDYFQIIIFSETISNKSIYQILSNCHFRKAILFLKTTEPLSLKEQQLWTQKGMTYFISRETTFDTVRESLQLNNLSTELYSYDDNRDMAKIIFNVGEVKKESLEEFNNKIFSEQERVFLTELEKDGGLLSRKQLSKRLWGKEATQSTLSRLSNLTKNINRKLKEEGINTIYIQTVWGRGYCLMKKDTPFNK